MYLMYDGSIDKFRQKYFQKILDKLALPKNARILDYGCGPGDFIVIGKASGYEVEGCDTSDYSIELARKRGIEPRKADYNDLIRSGDTYDAIMVQSVLEHVHDAVAFVEGLAKCLKPNGVLVLSSPTPGPYFWDDPTHVRPHTIKSFNLLGEMAGLKVEYNSYVGSFLLGWKLKSPLIFPLMNIIPASLGSNIVAFMRRPAA